jgi:hypothetical protein
MAEIFQVKLYLENVKARIDEKESILENKLLSIQSLETDLLIKQEKSELFKTELLEKEVLLSSGLELINQEKEELKNNRHYLESRILEIEQKELSLRSLENTFANREYEIEATRKSLEDTKKEI